MAALRPSRHESNDRLRDTLDRLMRVVVTVPFFSARDGEPRLVKTHLFDFFDLSANERASNATIRFGLPKRLQPVLARSSRWGRIKAETVCAMTSKYAIALYELVQLRAGMDRCVETLPIERFRELMGVPPGKLLRGPDFERRVIEPAVLEVNGLSDVGVQAELVRTHARAPITAVTLAWWRKQATSSALLRPSSSSPSRDAWPGCAMPRGSSRSRFLPAFPLGLVVASLLVPLRRLVAQLRTPLLERLHVGQQPHSNAAAVHRRHRRGKPGRPASWWIPWRV